MMEQLLCSALQRGPARGGLATAYGAAAAAAWSVVPVALADNANLCVFSARSAAVKASMQIAAVRGHASSAGDMLLVLRAAGA